VSIDRDGALTVGTNTALASLLEHSHTLAPHDLAGAIDAVAAEAGARALHLYLVDYDQQWLHPLDRDAPSLRVDTSVAGSAYRLIAERPEDEVGRSILWIPLVDGAERIGVMAAEHARDVEPNRPLLDAIASLAALLVHSKSSLTDVYAQARRRQRMSIAAEVQWELVPPLNYQTERVSISCMLEPAYDIGGDTFDYSHDGDQLHFALLDGMGRGRRAMLYASTAVMSLRHARRERLTIPAAYRAAGEAISEEFGDSVFVAGQIGALDLRDGTLVWVDAGNPPALLIRGERVIDVLGGSITPPLGVGVDAEPSRRRLEPSDRVLFLTDGITETGPHGEDLLGSRFHDFVETALSEDAPTVECLRRLMQRVRREVPGQLRDDATLMLLEFRHGS
jgi:hypothetical protein